MSARRVSPRLAVWLVAGALALPGCGGAARVESGAPSSAIAAPNRTEPGANEAARCSADEVAHGGSSSPMEGLVAWLRLDPDSVVELTKPFGGGESFEFTVVPGARVSAGDFGGERFHMPGRTAELLKNEAPRMDRVFLPVHKASTRGEVTIPFAVGSRADRTVQPLNSCLDTAAVFERVSDRMIARGVLNSRVDLFEKLADPAQAAATRQAFDQTFAEPVGSVPTSVPWVDLPPNGRSVLDDPAVGVRMAMISLTFEIEIPDAWTRMARYGLCSRTSYGWNGCIDLRKAGRRLLPALAKEGEDLELLLADGGKPIEKSAIGTVGWVRAGAIVSGATLKLTIKADKIDVTDPPGLLGPDTVTLQQ